MELDKSDRLVATDELRRALALPADRYPSIDDVGVTTARAVDAWCERAHTLRQRTEEPGFGAARCRGVEWNLALHFGLIAVDPIDTFTPRDIPGGYLTENFARASGRAPRLRDLGMHAGTDREGDR